MFVLDKSISRIQIVLLMWLIGLALNLVSPSWSALIYNPDLRLIGILCIILQMTASYGFLRFKSTRHKVMICMLLLLAFLPFYLIPQTYAFWISLHPTYYLLELFWR